MDSAKPTAGERPAVLVVEDHPNVAKATMLILGHLGYQGTLTSCVADAAEASRTQHFDILLSDYRLPDGTGVDVLKNLRALQPGAAAVLMTAYGKDYAAAARDAGFEQVLEKPLDLDALRTALDQARRDGNSTQSKR